MSSIYANLLGQKKAFTWEKSSTPRGLCWYTNMAAVSLFWNTNMAAVTSCENALFYGLVLYEFSVAQADRAPARYLGGHRFESCRGLRFFLCPTLVTCWLFHLHICSPSLKCTIFHTFTIFIISWNKSKFLSVVFFRRPTVGESQLSVAKRKKV